MSLHSENNRDFSLGMFLARANTLLSNSVIYGVIRVAGQAVQPDRHAVGLANPGRVSRTPTGGNCDVR